ncbi:type II toxin-antitoxin system HipA family toxin YjjJ [Rhodoferax sp.]|uniref:type II toxin-antitoxin system HipA family toxin YjjJ n=1 Tax=Rhodoferax sp. TaxID=50421 RepID=UPI0027326EE1|nr:type II toxin-antitoxin system HipA family toxin YjjJ [Rhodoferax sp.]MDP3190283.1 type II toxin-antitoxin system HipA family toxin YjjJ [Rhodoferax sp.]
MNDDLLQALRAMGGLATSAELQQRLGVSQPTVSRWLVPLLRSGQVLKAGAARSQRYLLPRPVEGVGSVVPMMRVDAEGRATAFGRMVPLPGGRFWVDEADGLSELHDGLPWFLQDMRPQGFMGRTFANAHPELRLPGDLRHWSDDDVLKALVQAGDDLPGNLIVGQPAFERFHSLPQRISRIDNPEQDYPRLAEQAMQGTLPGSSAGGEQPKFCTTLKGQSVIVKFSPAGEGAFEQRWRDLLICEHLALHTLAQRGVPAAETRIVIAGGRVFLEARRFDRTAQGRIGMVSLLVYDGQYVGQMDEWAATSERMAQRELLIEGDAAHLRLLDAFGALIGNTDRHYGNISLLLVADDWRLSPTYDMLPMLYAPVNGELVERDFHSRPLLPTVHTLKEWPKARELAQSFWSSVADDERISAAFRQIARHNRDIVARL